MTRRTSYKPLVCMVPPTRAMALSLVLLGAVSFCVLSLTSRKPEPIYEDLMFVTAVKNLSDGVFQRHARTIEADRRRQDEEMKKDVEGFEMQLRNHFQIHQHEMQKEIDSLKIVRSNHDAQIQALEEQVRKLRLALTPIRQNTTLQNARIQELEKQAFGLHHFDMRHETNIMSGSMLPQAGGPRAQSGLVQLIRATTEMKVSGKVYM